MRPYTLSSYQMALASVALSALCACGPTVRSSLQGNESLPASVAVLPAEYITDITRERVELVRADLIAELRNNRFVVADDKLVLSTCSSPQCPERAALADKYSIDGFVSLKLASFSKNNFLAGYYNALSGELAITDKSGKELVNVNHTESEKGGIILESGQVFQGIISQIKHSGDSVFEGLASKFTKRMIEELPVTGGARTIQQPEASEVALNEVQTTVDSPSTFRICAKGTPSSFAYVLLGKDKTTLREIRPGEYCGAFSSLAIAPTGGSTSIELRSAFGNSVRRDVTFPLSVPCSLAQRLKVEGDDKGRTLTVLCAVIGKDTQAVLSGCSEALPECKADKVVLYKGATAQGPFQKVSELRTASSAIPASPGSFQVVAVGPGGISSLPAPLEIKPQ